MRPARGEEGSNEIDYPSHFRLFAFISGQFIYPLLIAQIETVEDIHLLRGLLRSTQPVRGRWHFTVARQLNRPE